MNDSLDMKSSVEQNGSAVLVNRIRELQLNGKMDSGKIKNENNSSWLPWLLCLLLAISWAGVGIRNYRNNSNKNVQSQDSNLAQASESNRLKLKGNLNRSVTPSKTDMTNGELGSGVDTEAPEEIVLEGKGNIIPAHQIAVSPIDVAGRIKELYIEEGKRFVKGQLLATIDSTRFQADYQLALAQAASAKARYLEQEFSRKLLIEQYEFEYQSNLRSMEKAKFVFETNKRNHDNRAHSISDVELMQSEKEMLSAQMMAYSAERKRDLIKGEARTQQIEALKQEWYSAEAKVNQAKWYLNNCQIVSPITGVILTKKAEQGNLINPVVGGVSTSLCEIADLSDLEVELDILERDIKKSFVGQKCIIRTDAYPERAYEGYVDRALPIANRSKGILPVRIKIIIPSNEEQGQYLKPEMNVTVAFLNRHSKLKPERLTLPTPIMEP